MWWEHACRAAGMGVVVAAAVCLPAVVACASQRSTDHQASTKRVDLDPTLYWFYEGMGQLQEVATRGDRIEGAFFERQRLTPFTVPAAAVRNPAARTAGYMQAVERIVAFMRPGAVADTEANRQYLGELQSKLKTMTGRDFTTYDEWKAWLDANRDKLKWSDAGNALVVEP